MASAQRAASEKGAHPDGGANCINDGIGRPGGACRPEGRSCHRRSRNRSARGAQNKDCRALRSASRDARDRARHQPRSTSRGVAGCPRRRGSRRQHGGSGSGEAFPRTPILLVSSRRAKPPQACRTPASSRLRHQSLQGRQHGSSSFASGHRSPPVRRLLRSLRVFPRACPCLMGR